MPGLFQKDGSTGTRGYAECLPADKEKWMKFNEYQIDALKTANALRGGKRLAYLALGLTGESGEVAEHIKKYVGHGHALDREALSKELGDVLWYLAAMADALGLELGEIAKANIAKLRARYPAGFSSERSINRDQDHSG